MCRVSHPIVRDEWTTPFGSRVVPDVKPITAGASGSTVPGRVERLGVEHRRERGRLLRQRDLVACRDEPQRVGVVREQAFVEFEVVAVAEAIDGHDDVGLGGPQDVPDFLRAVEMNDRHHHGADVGRGPERDAGLRPVRQLEHRDITRADALGLQRRGERPGGAIDVGESPPERPELRMHLEGHVGLVRQSGGHHLAQRLVGP